MTLGKRDLKTPNRISNEEKNSNRVVERLGVIGGEFLEKESEKLDVSLEIDAYLQTHFKRLANGITVGAGAEEILCRRQRVESKKNKPVRRMVHREESPKHYPPIDMNNVPKPEMVRSQIIDLDRYLGEISPVKPKEALKQRARIERQPKNQFFQERPSADTFVPQILR